MVSKENQETMNNHSLRRKERLKAQYEIVDNIVQELNRIKRYPESFPFLILYAKELLLFLEALRNSKEKT
jgi:hypothetical protein